jgi:hypothetical protein
LNDLNADRTLLLGTLGWERDDWLRSYYPEDLPPEWRLAYYANDCACVMLDADQWGRADHEMLASSLDEVGQRLHFFLEQPSRQSRPARENLALFPADRSVLLVDRPEPEYSPLPQWVAQGAARWIDTRTGTCLLRWSLDVLDMRHLRARVEQMPASVRALVLGGAAASPGRIPELKTLLELMGKA